MRLIAFDSRPNKFHLTMTCFVHNQPTTLKYHNLSFVHFLVVLKILCLIFIFVELMVFLSHSFIFSFFFLFERLAVNSLVKASQWCLSFLTVIRGHMHSEYAWNKEAMNLQLKFVTGPVCIINICVVNQNCLLWHFQTHCY